MEDVDCIDDGNKPSRLIAVDDFVASLDQRLDIGSSDVPKRLAVWVTQELGQETTVLQVFNLAYEKRPNFLGIAVEILVQGRTERTMLCPAQLLLQIQDGVNDSLLELFRSRRQQVEDIEHGGNDLHLGILLEEGEGELL